ncbi:hypothetical protein BV22DRAFT_247735 [Leucogyrophana mollusca]|uniref:Uncharacterized protein n=1 Tax=Leucogyrophana mollusca TaxID=85980 RepID=A0ACB8BPC0_9AGAM|nr:hypothetical protein BV22DRAFT_247735 [Leucogyrophana mollusca]
MSVVSKAVRSMRIIALPLTRPQVPPDTRLKPSAVFNTNRMLVYYHFNLMSAKGDGNIEAEQPRVKQLVKWMSTKAADVWAGFGKAPEGSWKLRTYEYDVAGRAQEKSQESREAHERVLLIYPPSIYKSLPAAQTDGVHPCLAHLRTLLKSREPRHRKGFWTWMIIAPLTAPFMIIPVIPNLPFFFCAWRSWSHYRAYRSSQYLSSLLDHGLIVPKPSEELDQLYASSAPSAPVSSHANAAPSSNPSSETLSQSHSSTSTNRFDTSGQQDAPKPPQRLLLTRKAVPRILELFGLPESAGADMYRAVEQVRGRLGGGSGR